MLHSNIELYKTIKQLHADTVTLLQRASSEITRSQDIKEFCDFAYALSRMIDLLEDVTKEMNKKKMLAEVIACKFAVQQDIMGAVETEYVKATPKPKVGVSLPGFTKDRPAFDKLMGELGVPESLYKNMERPLARLDYPSVSTYVSDLMEEGKVLPDCFKAFKQSPILTLVLRGQKEVDA